MEQAFDKQKTHLAIRSELVGRVEMIEDGFAKVSLQTSPEMAADEHGLVHGGFAFGLADYAAMLAVNDPHVVLGAATSRLLAPVRVGQIMVAEARIFERKGPKRIVNVEVSTEKKVFEGEFTCVILDHHVLASS